MESWNPQMMMDKYIYNYLVTKGLHKTAEVFSIEANVVNPKNVAIESPEGYLMEWWDRFYDIYNTYAEKAQLSYVKVLPKLFQDAWTADNVGYHILSNVPTYSPNTATPVHDISHVEPTFHLTSPEDELRADLSQPMEQIPSMPQQSEGKEEGEGDNINFERTVHMEPNSRLLKKIRISVPEPSEAGCSTGSSSMMQQNP